MARDRIPRVEIQQGSLSYWADPAPQNPPKRERCYNLGRVTQTSPAEAKKIAQVELKTKPSRKFLTKGAGEKDSNYIAQVERR